MPDIDLDAIEARANAATEGPWVVKHEPAWEADDVQHPDVITVGAQMWEGDDEPMTVCLVSTDHEDDPVDVLGDAEFIAHARTDVPALVALVRAKQSWIDGAKVDMAAMEEERAKALAAVRRLREDADEGDALRTKLADLLSRTAVALNGPEPDLVQWSWHDLPEKAQYAMTLLLAVKSYDDANQSDLPLGLLDSIRAICAALDVRHDPSATTDGGEG